MDNTQQKIKKLLLFQLIINIFFAIWCIYYEGKNIAGIYDNRLLLKNTDNLSSIMDEFILEKPYPNAKDMVVADNLEDSEYLANIFNFLYDRLPFPKKKK